MMMKYAAVVLLSVSLIACGEREETSSAVAPPIANQQQLTPEQLGELGAQIQKEPNRAKEILAQHGLTEETFEAEIRRVTQDPEASRRYAAAFNKPAA